jgi:hypothetical protein
MQKIKAFAQAKVLGSSGGTGRHAGLKILWEATPVRVRFPPRVL